MKEFFNNCMYGIKEARVNDIDKEVEGNSDYCNSLAEIKSDLQNIKNGSVMKLIEKIMSLINLVQDITYMSAFKDGVRFHNDLLKNNNINIICPNCRGEKKIINPEFDDYWEQVEFVANKWNTTTAYIEESVNEQITEDSNVAYFDIDNKLIKIKVPLSKEEEIICPECKGKGKIGISNFIKLLNNSIKDGDI